MSEHEHLEDWAMRRVSLADVARAAGVAKATASRALSAEHREVGEATRARILEIATEMGYQPSRVAQALRTGRSNLIVVCLPPEDDRAWGAVLRGAAGAAERLGHRLVLRSGPGGELPPGAEADGLPPAGVVVIGGPGGGAVDGGPLPVVHLDEDLVAPERTVVRTANFDAGYRAGLHLIEQGRRSVAVLAPPSGAAGAAGAAGAGGARARIAGCQAALAEAGLPVGGEMLIRADAPTGLDSAIRRRAQRIDGVFGCETELAAAALAALRRAGRSVPQDVSVIAFGDGRTAGLTDPPLTVMLRPEAELGARAVELVVRAGAGEVLPREAHELPARLLAGGTSLAPR